MKAAKNTLFYKVISLFIKSLILFLSFYYIWDKLQQSSVVFDFPHLFSSDNKIYTITIFLLMFVNWSLEAFKWKLLIAPLELITFSSSLKGIFSGVTISIFTPNRVGEFAGRVFFLEKADKIKASIMSIIGSVIQLSVTIIAGVIAYFILKKMQFNVFQVEHFYSLKALYLLLALVFIVTAFLVFVILNRKTTFISIKKNIEIMNVYSKKELSSAFCISVFRYIVFSIQYYLALRLFGINGGLIISFSLIALTFFVTSAIPTFALTEIAVRAGVAIYFFGTICSVHSSILAASLFLWIINLAIPALIGSGFVWKLKLNKL